MTPLGNVDPTSNLQSPISTLPRRNFLTLAGRSAVWATLGASLVALARFIGFTEPKPPRVVTLDTPDAYPPGALVSVAEGRAFIGHDERGLYAIASTCTHLGCPVKPVEGRFECPCHGSRFDAAGSVLRGPAERSLDRAALTLDAQGRLVLELDRAVEVVFRLPLDAK